MNNIALKIKELAQLEFSNIQAIRQTIHQNPELSFEEYKTAEYIRKLLVGRSIPYTEIAETGTIATIVGENPGPIRALRADIDALPIQEENDVPYASKVKGLMHACGHDVHTACVLGATFILHSCREMLSGTVQLIFQPGEEKLPGGACIIIEEGGLKNPDINYMIGQHVHPPLEVGKVGVKGGPYMASADEIYITVKGKGGHAALPENCIDPILIASHIIVNLQSLISRNSDPLSPSVLTIGKIQSGGGATNIIPDEVKLEGTFRAMDEKWRDRAHIRIREIAQHTALAFGGTIELEIRRGYPSLYNDPILTQNIKSRMIEYLGKDHVVDLPIRMTAEDFAYYSQQIPSCFYRLGTGNSAKGIDSPVHTSTFDIDEEALITGAGLMAYLAFCTL